jgi:hypothetical protein
MIIQEKAREKHKGDKKERRADEMKTIRKAVCSINTSENYPECKVPRLKFSILDRKTEVTFLRKLTQIRHSIGTDIKYT